MSLLQWEKVAAKPTDEVLIMQIFLPDRSGFILLRLSLWSSFICHGRGNPSPTTVDIVYSVWETFSLPPLFAVIVHLSREHQGAPLPNVK